MLGSVFANDLGRFATALLRGGELNGVRILTPESVQLMARPEVAIKKGAPRKGMTFGRGWFRSDEDDRVVLAHGGGGARIARAAVEAMSVDLD